jgi:hypothetical protein
MIRTLVIIAVAGLFVSVVTLSAAVGIAGPDAVAHGAWTWGPNGWGRDRDDSVSESRPEDRVQTTRRIAWSGGDTLTVELPADVTLARASGPPQIAINGPVEAVADVVIDDGVVRYQGRDRDTRVILTVAAPPVTRIVMKRHGAITLAPPPRATPAAGHAPTGRPA